MTMIIPCVTTIPKATVLIFAFDFDFLLWLHRFIRFYFLSTLVQIGYTETTNVTDKNKRS